MASARCAEIDRQIARYREIAALDIDPETTLSMEVLIAELEVEKTAIQKELPPLP